MPFAKNNNEGLLTRFKKQEGAIVKSSCLNCGIPVTSYRSNNKRYCSKTCFYTALSDKTGNLHHNYLRVTTVCALCSTPFEHLPSKQRKFCSRKCAAQTVPGMPKEQNPNWKGGVTPLIKAIRTSKDYSLWRSAVFLRDEYQCQQCGKRKNLHAHHIEKVSENLSRIFDITNGVTLCITCHQEQHPELQLTMGTKEEH